MASNLPQQNAINQYLADGVTVQYNFNFIIMQNADLAVYVTLPGNIANPVVDFVPSDQYTITYLDVSALPPGAGYITFTVAPVSGAIVTLARDMQISISTNFAAAQNFNGANLDTAFERIGLILQQMQGYFYQDFQNGSISRCFQLAIDTYLPTNAPVLLPNLTVNSQNQPTNNQVWVSLNGGITVAPLFTGGDANTLAGLLASETMGAPGAALVGYYDTVNNVPQTVNTFLQNLPTFFNNLNYVRKIDLQDGVAVSADDTGAANALVITLSPALLAYVNYNRFYVKAANTCTGACTINVNGLGAEAIVHTDGSAILAGEIVAGMVLELVREGTSFQLLNPIIRVATNAETIAGTNTIHPVTPANLIASYAAGYNVAGASITLPGGLIIKWGVTVPISPGNEATLAFAVPFPTQIISWSVVPRVANAGSSIVFGVDQPNTNVNGIKVVNSPGSNGAAAFDVIALGN